MMAPPPTPDDLYAVLGVPPDADAVAIKRAYRRRALENHPDVSKEADAKERFLAIQTAYSTLSDVTKRQEYDRRRARGGAGGSAWDDWAAGVAGATRGATGSSADGSVFSDDYWRRWRAANPSMGDLDDSWGAVLGDLFSGISGAVAGGVGAGTGAGKGFLDDFVEFLERTVDGFDRGAQAGTATPGAAGSGRGGSSRTSAEMRSGATAGSAAAAGGYTDDMLEEVLASRDPDVLASELDDTRFILSQLRARAKQLRSVAADADSRLRRARSAAAVAGDGSEAASRAAAAAAESARVRSRLADVDAYIARQAVRERKLADALSAGKMAAMKDAKTARAKAVDDELERMRKELGM